MDTDSGARIKVVCRYQQFRAAGKICDSLRRGNTQAQRSGVVWHTQGSGKSFGVVNVSERILLMIDEAHRIRNLGAGLISDQRFCIRPVHSEIL